jgi:aromatic-amino-acid transaminase
VTDRYSSIIEPARDRAGNDPIFSLYGEALGRIAAGESILNLTMGALMTDDGHLCTLPTVLETLARAQGERASGYSPIAGVPAFRSAVIHDLFDDSSLADQALSVATPGGSGAIFQAVVNFLEPHHKMLVPSFYWGPYSEITHHTRREVDTFPMFTAEGAFDIEAMAAGLDRHMADQGRALLVLNFPCHNPTGYTLSPDEWQKIASVVRRVGALGPLTVLIDVAYMEFAGPEARTWVEAVPELLESSTVLVSWTASKSLAQYGSRVGALVALHRDETERSQIENALGYSCRATWSNCNHLGQIAVAELLTDPALVERTRDERAGLQALLQERIDAFNQQAAVAGLQTPRYDSGFFVAVFTEDELVTAAAMRELGVYITPIPGAARVAICATPASAVPRLVEALRVGVAAAE